MKVFFLFLSLIFSAGIYAQRLAVPDLLTIVDATSKTIDTTLKKKGYLLMKREVDSTNTFYQYSTFNVDDEKNEPNIRTLNYMDVSVRDIKSRLVTYRTYDKDEYQEIASYLLTHNFHSTGYFDFKESKHTLYSNGQQTIRVKVIDTQLTKSKKKIVAYELELGK
ncbi:MAG: hypothetical protein QM731_14815 [Chitinophagaceae bacterium]